MIWWIRRASEEVSLNQLHRVRRRASLVGWVQIDQDDAVALRDRAGLRLTRVEEVWWIRPIPPRRLCGRGPSPTRR